MSGASAAEDWDPGAYLRFRGHRLRPALDLLSAVPDVPAGDIVDLGCGTGAVGAALAAAYPAEVDGSAMFPFRRLFFTLTV